MNLKIVALPSRSSAGTHKRVSQTTRFESNCIEWLTSASPIASFDINKDGFMVARLTLVKTAYRLGETVNGSILLNSGEGRVIRVSQP